MNIISQAYCLELVIGQITEAPSLIWCNGNVGIFSSNSLLDFYFSVFKTIPATSAILHLMWGKTGEELSQAQLDEHVIAEYRLYKEKVTLVS